MEEEGLQFVKDGVPYCWELKSTVQIHGGTSLPNEDGFCSPPLPVVGDHLFHLGTFPINVVVKLLYMYSDAMPVITSPYSLSVLSESGLQVPLCLTYVHLVTTICRGPGILQICSSLVVPSSSRGPKTASWCWLA